MSEHRLIDLYLKELREALRFPPPLQERILDEVEDHLSEGTERDEARGLSPDLAQRRAIARFGTPERVAAWMAAEYPANIAASPLAVDWFMAQTAADGGMNMWQRFTERARRVVFFAQEDAARFGENNVRTEHLLLGLVREDDSVAARILARLGVSLDRIREDIEKQITRGQGIVGQDMELTPPAKMTIDEAYAEARERNVNYIGTEHLLLGLIREPQGLGGRVLREMGATLERTRQETQIVLEQTQQGQPDPLAIARRQVEEARRRFAEAQSVYDALSAAAAATLTTPAADAASIAPAETPAADSQSSSDPPAAPAAETGGEPQPPGD